MIRDTSQRIVELPRASVQGCIERLEGNGFEVHAVGTPEEANRLVLHQILGQLEIRSVS